LRTELGLILLIAVGCADMKDQPRVEPLEESLFYADGSSARMPVEGTIARGQLRLDDKLYRGVGPDGKFSEQFPMSLDAALLQRGRERYDIFCSPCHDQSGDGLGMVVRRGFQRPPTFHETRLVEMPVGYFYDVISHGFNKMSSYASQISVEDRWAIVAYIRALQLRRAAKIDDLPADLQVRLRRREIVDSSAPEVVHEPTHH
jgi:cytochrome c